MFSSEYVEVVLLCLIREVWLDSVYLLKPKLEYASIVFYIVFNQLLCCQQVIPHVLFKVLWFLMVADFELVFFIISLFFSLKAMLFLLFCPNFNEAVPRLFLSMFPSTKSLTSKRWFHSVHGHPTMKQHARMLMLTSLP